MTLTFIFAFNRLCFTKKMQVDMTYLLQYFYSIVYNFIKLDNRGYILGEIDEDRFQKLTQK